MHFPAAASQHHSSRRWPRKTWRAYTEEADTRDGSAHQVGARVRRLKVSLEHRFPELELRLVDPSQALREGARRRGDAAQKEAARTRYEYVREVMARVQTAAEQGDDSGRDGAAAQEGASPAAAVAPIVLSREHALHVLLARASNEIYAELTEGNARHVSVGATVVKLQVVRFVSAGSGGWKRPQWALFRTRGLAQGEAAVLAFKGTEHLSEWTVDAMAAARTVEDGTRMHGAISANLEHLGRLADLGECVRELLSKEALPLYLTGHSLGGAYAHCAAHLAQLPISDISGIVTFGAPLVIHPRPGAPKLDPSLFVSYVNGNDVVPRLLFDDPLSRRWVVETLRGLGVSDLREEQLPSFPPMGEYRALPSGEVSEPSALLRMIVGAVGSTLSSHVEDHSMSLYAEVLERLEQGSPLFGGSRDIPAPADPAPPERAADTFRSATEPAPDSTTVPPPSVAPAVSVSPPAAASAAPQAPSVPSAAPSQSPEPAPSAAPSEAAEPPASPLAAEGEAEGEAAGEAAEALAQLKLSELRQRLAAAGVDGAAVDEALDEAAETGSNAKQALIALLQTRSRPRASERPAALDLD